MHVMLYRLLYKILCKILRKNPKSTPKEVILDQLNERRPLPMGMKDFDVWADRIISGTLIDVPDEVLAEANHTSLKFALSTMLLHLGPQESHKEDAYFIHSLRKSAVNQIAHAKMKELKDAAQKKADEEKEKKDAETLKASEQAVEETKKRIKKAVPPKEGTDSEILANKEV